MTGLENIAKQVLAKRAEGVSKGKSDALGKELLSAIESGDGQKLVATLKNVIQAIEGDDANDSDA